MELLHKKNSILLRLSAFLLLISIFTVFIFVGASAIKIIENNDIIIQSEKSQNSFSPPINLYELKNFLTEKIDYLNFFKLNYLFLVSVLIIVILNSLDFFKKFISFFYKNIYFNLLKIMTHSKILAFGKF